MLHDSLLHQSASATDVDFVALTRNPVDHTILFKSASILFKSAQAVRNSTRRPY